MTTLDVKSSDVWLQSDKLRWGKYLTDIEMKTIKEGMQILSQRGPQDKKLRALDVGAEAGRLTKRLISEGLDVSCTEICPKKVARCKQLNPSADCHLVGIEDSSFPIPDNSIDLGVCVEVPVSEQPWFFNELNRTLTDRGVAVFSINNVRSYRGVLTNVRSRLTGDEVHYEKNYGQIKRSLLDHGFEFHKAIGYCWAPFPRLSDSPLIPFMTSCENWLQLRKIPSISPWVMIVCQKTA